MAQVRGFGPRVGSRLALFCIHRVNRVYAVTVQHPCSDFIDMLRTYGAFQIVVSFIVVPYELYELYDWGKVQELYGTF